MSAKFDRVRSDLYPLVPLILSAAQFPSRRGRPVNWRVRSLFEACISKWAHAADQPPSGGQTDGQVNSPLLTLLRELVYPTTQDVEVAEALSDAVYLDVLADMKRRRKGLLLSPVIPARRRRGSNVSRIETLRLHISTDHLSPMAAIGRHHNHGAQAPGISRVSTVIPRMMETPRTTAQPLASSLTFHDKPMFNIAVIVSNAMK